MQRSPHPYRVVLNSLEKGFVEQGMDSSTRKKTSIRVMVVTYGSSASRRLRKIPLDPMDFQMFKRMHFHGVALLNSLSHHLVSNVFDFAALRDLAILTSLLHLFIKLHTLLCVKRVPQYMQNTEITCFFSKIC